MYDYGMLRAVKRKIANLESCVSDGARKEARLGSDASSSKRQITEGGHASISGDIKAGVSPDSEGLCVSGLPTGMVEKPDDQDERSSTQAAKAALAQGGLGDQNGTPAIAKWPLQEALEVVERDRTYRRDRRQIGLLREGLPTGERAIAGYNVDPNQLRIEDADRNAYEIEQIQGHIRYIDNVQASYERDQPDVEARMNYAWERRSNIIDRMIQAFQQRVEIGSRHDSRLPLIVVEAISIVIETQAQVEAEGKRQAAVQTRQVDLRTRIERIEEQMDLDVQLNQTDDEKTQTAEQDVARYGGTLQVVTVQIEFYERNIVELNRDRDEADMQLCEALEAMLVKTSILEVEH